VTVAERTMYLLRCDICGASEEATYDGIVAWTDPSSAVEVALESGWTVKDGRHYCPSHWVCEGPGCHVELGPLAGEVDYLCEEHR
jgi:hypothetical protein